MNKELNKLVNCIAFHVVPSKMLLSLRYKRRHGKRMNWSNPKTYDEWIVYHMAKTYNKSYGRYADKLLVRQYITECGFEDMLVPLHRVFNNELEIEYWKLPSKYILMANHGSGDDFYQIYSGNEEVDIDAVRHKFHKALTNKFYYRFFEYQYVSIKPCILCLEYLDDKKGDRLTDYKLVCSYGSVKAILVCTDRDQGRDYFSTDWEYLEYTKKEYRSKQKIEKPEGLNEMILAAQVISKPFPLARIDFYYVEGKVYFSEITLTPSAGNHQYLTDKGQIELGKMVKIF